MLALRPRASHRHNDIDLKPDKLGRDLGITLGASLGPTIVNDNGAALDPSQFAQPLHKSGQPLALGCQCARTQVPNGWQLRGLLRARRERATPQPRRRAA